MKTSPIAMFIVFAIGVGTGFLIAKRLLEDKYAQIAEDEIESVKETFSRRKKKNDSPKENQRMSYEDPRPVINPSPYSAIVRGINSSKSEEAKKNFQIVPSDKEENCEDGEESDKDDSDEDRDPTEPYLITEDEYMNDNPNFDKSSLYFYSYDEVLCGDDEQPLDDIPNTVGTEFYREFENGETIVWIRNESLGQDFEICIVYGSYAQAVQGINVNENLSPRERYVKTKLKNKEE